MKYKILLVALLFCVIVPDFSFGSSFIGAIKNAFSTIQQSPKKTSASRVQA